MKVAIVHYWLVGMRGGEKVLEALCDLFPQADLYAHVVDRSAISKKLENRVAGATFINRLPAANKNYKSYLPLMPLASEQLDLRDYDLIITSESGPAKGVVPPPNAVHICYCHSPMRYVWNMYHDYRNTAGFVTRMVMPILTHYLRQTDVTSAARVDHFVANADNVARRVKKYYRRDASVIYPPVAVQEFSGVTGVERGPDYLMVGELVSYKRPDLAIEAFNRSGRPLTVIGGGEMLDAVRALAKPNVRVLGSQPFEELKRAYARSRALIFPGEEDFGIVPVEAMAAGCPVIAYGQGGATETVLEGITGTFFYERSVEALNAAIDRFEATAFDEALIRKHAESFDEARFKREFAAFVAKAMDRSPATTSRPLIAVGGGAHA